MNSDKDGKVMKDDLHVHITQNSVAVSKQPAAADLGLVQNLDSGLWTGLWTEIWTRFWTDAQGNDDHFQETMEGTVLQLQARLVTSSLVRTFPGPSGYEVKSQGASLEATCKHVEVAKSVSPAGMASPHRNGLQYHRDAYEGY